MKNDECADIYKKKNQDALKLNVRYIHLVLIQNL